MGKLQALIIYDILPQIAVIISYLAFSPTPCGFGQIVCVHEVTAQTFYPALSARLLYEVTVWLVRNGAGHTSRWSRMHFSLPANIRNTVFCIDDYIPSFSHQTFEHVPLSCQHQKIRVLYERTKQSEREGGREREMSLAFLCIQNTRYCISPCVYVSKMWASLCMTLDLLVHMRGSGSGRCSLANIKNTRFCISLLVNIRFVLTSKIRG